MSAVSKFCVISGLLFASAAPLASRGLGQTFPSFPTGTYQPSYMFQQGTSAATVPNGVYGNVVMSVFAPTNANFGWAVSNDGTNYVSGGVESAVPQVNCNAGTPSTCGAAIAYFNGQIYIAYSEAGSHGLVVLTATPVPGATGYTFNQVWQDTSVALNTTPQMCVSPDGSHLVLMYGTSNDPATKNQFFETTLDLNNNWTVGTEDDINGEPTNLRSLRLSSASRAAMSVLNGTLYLCSQQNNSNHQLFIYSSVDGISWNFVRQDSSLALGGGAQMVTYNGFLVLANQQNNSNHDLFIFMSSDGFNWTAQGYTNIQMGGDPGLALFNGGLALVFRQNTFGDALYGSFAF